MKRERFKVLRNGYKFDRRLFLTASWVIIFISLLLVLFYGIEENIYFACPPDAIGYCQNPFYDPVGNCLIADEYLCNTPVFPPGFEYGEKPSWLLSNIALLYVVLLIGVFITNHYVHNERFAR